MDGWKRDTWMSEYMEGWMDTRMDDWAAGWDGWMQRMDGFQEGNLGFLIEKVIKIN